MYPVKRFKLPSSCHPPGKSPALRPPPRPVITDDAVLQAALDKLEDVTSSPEQRFSAWTQALRTSLRRDRPDDRPGCRECLAWLAFQHATGANCSDTVDACVELSDLTPEQLDTAFDWFESHGISLPVNLELNGQALDDAETQHVSTILLRDAGSIRSLSLIRLGTRLTDDTVQRLADALQGNQSLRSLKLVRCYHGTLLGKISQALKGNRSIEELDVSESNWDAASLTHLAEALNDHGRLRKLNLVGIRSTDSGLARIFESLKRSSIEEIQLSSTSYCPADAAALGELLAQTKTLKVLNLSFPFWHLFLRRGTTNPLVRTVKHVLKAKPWEQKVVDRIFLGIANNSSLTSLDIRGWILEESHVKSLGAALLQPWCQLHTIKMTPLDDKASEALLRQAAVKNQTLTSCSTSDRGLEAIIGRNREHLEKLHKETPANLGFMFSRHHLPPDVCGLIGGLLVDLHDRLNVENVALRVPERKQSRGPDAPPLNSPGSP